MTDLRTFWTTDPETGQPVVVCRYADAWNTAAREYIGKVAAEHTLDMKTFFRHSPLSIDLESLGPEYRAGAKDCLAALRTALGMEDE